MLVVSTSINNRYWKSLTNVKNLFASSEKLSWWCDRKVNSTKGRESRGRGCGKWKEGVCLMSKGVGNGCRKWDRSKTNFSFILKNEKGEKSIAGAEKSRPHFVVLFSVLAHMKYWLDNLEMFLGLNLIPRCQPYHPHFHVLQLTLIIPLILD